MYNTVHYYNIPDNTLRIKDISENSFIQMIMYNIVHYYIVFIITL